MCHVKENVAVLFISGQSNAHGHGQALEEHERITTPLKNVFSLDRDPNQSFDITDVVWSGFTGAGKNLGEIQDHTRCFAYYFSKMWQKAIDEGAALPDLYIVQISIGGEGILNGMWNRDKEKVMIPGKLGTADISLFPWALQVNQLVMSHLKRAGKNPIVIGWHWIGSEQDIREGGYDREDFLERYDTFFDEMLKSIGERSPLYLYKIYLEGFCEVQGISDKGIQPVNEALLRESVRLENVQFVDMAHCPYWDDTDACKGIFWRDKAHYLGKTQEWLAQRFFTEVYGKFING